MWDDTITGSDMPDAPDVETIIEQRQTSADYWAEAHSRFDLLIDSYHGNFQKMWPSEFRRGEVPKVANWIKLGWDRYSKMVGKLPTNHVTPSNIRRVSQSRADKVEKVLAHYDLSSGMSNLMKWYAWYLVGLGAAAIGVMPDPVLKGPRYFVKDPRTVLPSPGAGSIPGTSASYGMLSKPTMSTMSLHSCIINETVTSTYLLDQYGNADPDMMDVIGRVIEDDHTLSTPYSHLVYMDKEWWVVLVGEEKIMEIRHNLGFVPLRFTTQYVPDQLGGQGQFEQNIGLVLAYMRLLNQKLTYNENIVWPWLILKGLNNIDTDSRVIEILDRDGDASFLNPPAELQAERDLEVLDRLIRVMNHDTESMQGQAPGGVVTGKGVAELNRDVRTMVSDYWDTMKPDIEFIKSAALIIDEKVYGGIKKIMFGRAKGEQFEEKYVPREVIKGNHNVVIDFGIGVGGLEGLVELMQVAAQGFVDEQTVMEQLPWIRSVSDTRRKVFLDRMEKIIFEMVGSGVPTPLVNHMANWRKAVEGGTDAWVWIVENPMPSPEPPPEMGAPGGEGALPPLGPEGAAIAPPGVSTPQIPSPQQILALAQGRR